jgi:hypothetical protein
LPRIEAEAEGIDRGKNNRARTPSTEKIRILRAAADVKALKDWLKTSLGSVIVSDFPEFFGKFRGKGFSLLWRGSCDGFGVCDFHSRCNDHPKPLTVVLDMNGNIFGGFTPGKLEGSAKLLSVKADPASHSFIFTLKNLDNVPARRKAKDCTQTDFALESRIAESQKRLLNSSRHKLSSCCLSSTCHPAVETESSETKRRTETTALVLVKAGAALALSTAEQRLRIPLAVVRSNHQSLEIVNAVQRNSGKEFSADL